jgi:hypothetical protein
MATPEILYITNDNTIEIPALTDATDESAITSATTASFALKDDTGAAVSGGTGTLSHDAAGRWLGNLADTVSLTNNDNYILEVTMVATAGKGFWRIPCKAQYRSE